MLGLRLDAVTEAGLVRMARRSGRTKSDIARDAIRDFIDRAERDADLKRELQAIAALTNEDELAALDAINEDLLDLVDDEERVIAAKNCA